MRRAVAVGLVIMAAGCGGGGGAEPETGAAPVERCELPNVEGGSRPYATLPFESATPADSLYPILRRNLEREGFDICAEDAERGVLATTPKSVSAPDGPKRRVAIGVYVTAAVRGSQGQLWVVQSEGTGDKAPLEAIARRLRTRLVGGAP
jgi:hypothetical protein